MALEPDSVTAQDGLAFTRELGFEDLWIFHGVAIKDRAGRAIVLTGPAGIGKSTLLRKVAGTGLAEPMDDGFVVVAKAGGSHCVIASGLYPSLRTISILSNWLRIMVGYQSPYFFEKDQRDFEGAVNKSEMLHNLAVLIGSIIMRDRSSHEWKSVPVRLMKLFLVACQGDRHPPRRICGEEMESIDAGSAARIFSDHASCEVIHLSGKERWRALYNRILAELESLPG